MKSDLTARFARGRGGRGEKQMVVTELEKQMLSEIGESKGARFRRGISANSACSAVKKSAGFSGGEKTKLATPPVIGI
jgi:hypothetical protein